MPVVKVEMLGPEKINAVNFIGFENQNKLDEVSGKMAELERTVSNS